MDNSIFYYINRSVFYSNPRILQPGDTLSTNNGYNPYFSVFYEKSFAIPLNTANYPTSYAHAVNFLQAASRGEIESPNLASYAYMTVRRTIECLREVLYENVRAEKFPDRPSRQKSLFLVPEKEYLQYWQDKLSSSGIAQLLKVKASGNIYVADEVYLMNEIEPLRKSIDRADKYWNGSLSSQPRLEALCEGSIEVIEVINP